MLSRADGAVAGVCCVHVVPFQIQVSARSVPDEPVPPKRTRLLCAWSKTRTESSRAGGDVAGVFFVQKSPSKVHVSLLWHGVAVVQPPKRTVCFRTAS